MGASYSQSTSESVQQTKLDQSQVAKGACLTNVVNDINNIRQDFTDVKITGNVNFAQKATADVSCIFENNLTSIAGQILDLYSANSTDTDKQRGLVGMLNLYSFNITDSTTIQDVEMMLRQHMENTCQTTIDQSMNNIEQTWLRVELEGDINYIQDADAYGSCVVSNLAKLETQLKAEAETNNNAGGARNFLFYIMIGGIIFVVIMLIVGVIFGRGKSKKEPAGDCLETPEVCQAETGEALEACLRALPPPPKPYCVLNTNQKSAPVESNNSNESSNESFQEEY